MSEKERIIDSKLVSDYQAGDLCALNGLVKNWHKTFCEKAFWLVKDADAAKDIAQDSWKTIIAKINDLKNPESFGSWALRIVYTKSIDWINLNNKTIEKHQVYSYEQELTTIDVNTDYEDLKRALLATVKKLPKQQQVVIKLFYVEDYSLKDISEMLDISIGTAKSRLFHAREKLKTIFKNRNYEN
ncbi:RNA polymerase sigma factor [Flavobacteriaceae bacterium SZ-1-7]|uniref:RNA polymerase sigma factor n=1 Tax=Tamlana sedimenti TaxID=3134126 RepID=UPI003129C2B5